MAQAQTHRRGERGLISMREAMGDVAAKALVRYEAAQARIRERGESIAQEQSCPSCGGSGWVSYDRPLTDPRFGQAELCPTCHPAPTMDDLFSGFQVPTEYPSSAQVQLRAVMTLARDVAAKGQPRWLVLSGPNGTGKTTLAMAIHKARRLIAGDWSIFQRSDSLLDWLRATQKPDAPASLEDRIGQVVAWDWLVLDEMGSGESEWGWTQLEKALNQRYAQGRGLVVTTNYDPLGERFPPALRSRFTDRGLCRVVYLPDVPDFRPRLRPGEREGR